MDGHREAQELVEEVEQGGRKPDQKWTQWLIFGLAVSWSLFQLSIASWLTLGATQSRAVHLFFGICLAFLVFPAKKKIKAYVSSIPWYDYAAAFVASLGTLYLVIEYEAIQYRYGVPNLQDTIVGTVTLLLLLEATRRALGPALTIIGAIFLAYAMSGPDGALWFLSPVMPELLSHRGYGIERIISQMYLTTEGVFGIALGVSTQFVFLFVLFGSLLDKAGAGNYFIQVANAFLGTFRGGPAKASVVASGMTGMVSGSSLANVVTTGTFTIPLMKKTGYPPYKAGAIEVAVSTNGQLMPPVMGAAAFIIAEFVGIAYFDVIRAAFIPAIVAYLALFFIVHLEAKRLGLKGLSREELPKRLKTFIQGVHYLIPLIILIYGLVILRLSPAYAVMQAICLLGVIMAVQEPIKAYLNGQSIKLALWHGFEKIYTGMYAGARNMVAIAVAVATAGMVVGTVNLTGLGLRLTEIIEVVSGGISSGIGFVILPIVDLLGGNIEAFSMTTQFSIILIITAITSLVLGLGLPTTANYVVMAAITAPIIFNLGDAFGFGMPLLAAHLFVFFFGILADDTPPVGLAAYAAAAIARSDPIRTGIQGFTYDMRTAILPFMFVFNEKLLLIGVDSWAQGIHIFLSALIGMLAFSSGMQGYLRVPTNLIERIVLLGIAFMLIQPNWFSDILGLTLFALVYAIQYWRSPAQNA